jgi:putative membrane protein
MRLPIKLFGIVFLKNGRKSSMSILINWFVSAIAVFVTAYLLPGVSMDGFFTALVVALVLGIVNSIVKPILFFFTLPITIITFGLFALVINACMILLTDVLVPGFSVHGFFWALLFSLVLSIVNWFLHSLSERK